MTTILLLGLGAVVACAGIAAWKIYGPQPPADSTSPAPSEHDGKNWVASDFAAGTNSSAPHSPASEPSDSEG